MKQTETLPSVLDFAFEVIQMHRKIEDLESQVENLLHYRDEYFKLCDDTTKQTERLFGIVVTASLGDFETAQAIAES
jgi:hypothetical protein